MTRTIKDINLATNAARTRDHILDWLLRNGFEILERNSSGQPIEKSFRSFKVRLTPRPGFIVALRTSRLGMIVFEVGVEPRDHGCVVHGEFYVAGASGGLVDYLGKEFDVCERPDLVGRLPRKKGFKLMGRFISGLGA